MKKFIAVLGLILALGVHSASADGHGFTGKFKGLSNHITEGTVEIVKKGDHYEIQLKNDFDFDGAPDPKWGFGNSGSFDANTIFAKLKKIKGAQTYRLPAGIDPNKYNEFYLWCERFNVPLGVARIKK